LTPATLPIDERGYDPWIPHSRTKLAIVEVKRDFFFVLLFFFVFDRFNYKRGDVSFNESYSVYRQLGTWCASKGVAKISNQ
jgi:hypothetical protein